VASQLHVASSYGLFASLTTKREEILIEGFNPSHAQRRRLVQIRAARSAQRCA
jgi:hypothetical protein